MNASAAQAVLYAWFEIGAINSDISSRAMRRRSVQRINMPRRPVDARYLSIQGTARADGHRPRRDIGA
jgi:hypothetical protein